MIKTKDQRQKEKVTKEEWCLSEVSFCFTYEESRGCSCSFAPRERMRSFLRTLDKKEKT